VSRGPALIFEVVPVRIPVRGILSSGSGHAMPCHSQTVTCGHDVRVPFSNRLKTKIRSPTGRLRRFGAGNTPHTMLKSVDAVPITVLMWW
jgi:hypothetical protein